MRHSKIGVRKNLVDTNWRSAEWKTEDTVERLETKMVARNHLQAWRDAWQAWAENRGRRRREMDPRVEREAQILFKFFDRDGSGLLDLGEVCATFHMIGIRIGGSLLRRVLAHFGKTRYDSLDFNSFVKLIHWDSIAHRISGWQKPAPVVTRVTTTEEDVLTTAEQMERQEKRREWLARRRYREVFDMIDYDGTGFIVREAVVDAITLAKAQFTEDAVDTLFSKVGKNVKDRVDFDEFVRMMQVADAQDTKPLEKAKEKRCSSDQQAETERIRKAPIRLPFNSICMSLRRRTMLEAAVQKASQLNDRNQLSEISEYGKRYRNLLANPNLAGS